MSIRFSPGKIVATPNALAVIEAHNVDVIKLLARHITGDWGDLDEEDKLENERSVISGFRILSAYDVGAEERIWIITEADRSATTVLLPSDY